MNDFCYYHPKQVLVGVCPFCLNERLLVIAAKQARRSRHTRHHHNHQEGVSQPTHSRKPSNAGLPKIFAFGSLLNRLEFRHQHRHNHHRETYECDEYGGGSDSQSTSTGFEDSFISIKFEANGVALWDKSKVSKDSQDQASKARDAPTMATCASTDYKGWYKEGKWKSHSNKSVVEHSKTPRVLLRWRKRIGHLLQLVRWRRSDKPNGGPSHVDGVGGFMKARNKGGMRTLRPALMRLRTPLEQPTYHK